MLHIIYTRIFMVYTITAMLDYSFEMICIYILLRGRWVISIFAFIYTTLLYQRYVQLHEGVSASFWASQERPMDFWRGKLKRVGMGKQKKTTKNIERKGGQNERNTQWRPFKSLSSAERGELLLQSSKETTSRPDRSEPNWIGDAGWCYGGVGNARALSL